MNTRELLHQLADVLADRLDAAVQDAGFYDQQTAPIPPHSYRRLIRRGELPASKVAGRLLVRKVDLHKYIERHRIQPLPGAAQEPTAEQPEPDEPPNKAKAVDQILKRIGVKRGTNAA